MKWIISKLTGKIDYLKRAIALYYWHPKNGVINSIGGITFREIRYVDDLNLINYKYEKSDYENRLLSGHLLFFLEEDSQALTYGWLNPSEEHILGELALKMELGYEVETLYDFHTFERYRGRGLYPFLLQKICSRNSKAKLIYAFPDNISSIKGIEKANFKLLGIIYGFNKYRYAKLIRNYEKNNF